MLYKITSAIPQPDYALHLTYSDGAIVVVDFKAVIAEGGVYAPLADARVFTQVSVGSRGRFIEWPGEIDFCADALRLEGKTLEVEKVPSSAT